MILLLSLFSPFAELFPNFYMSWWLPDNGKIKAYSDAWLRRVAVVFVVWSPILYTLGAITSTPVQLSIIALVFGAFGLRLYFFDSALHKLKGDDVNFTEPNKIPEILYFIAFTSIGWILYNTVPSAQWLAPFAISLIYTGAFMMGTFRVAPKKNMTKDVIGRVIFTFGFLLNLYNLARAAAII